MSDDTTTNNDAPMTGGDQPEAKPEGENTEGAAPAEGGDAPAA